ncbi:MAG TPA: Gfo/Idh/MocA family oxidoreductase [Gemmatimonadales bacterium]|nr:Gfo/Idh/MocA family oxidoreductase [Gemmatimonadales bacterium]
MRLGFLGVGWIGRHRLEAVAASGAAEIVAIADPSEENRQAARAAAPAATLHTSLEELLARRLDGIVIATPSALHADQAVAALEHGLAVFCQKPLGRSAAEVERVITAAASADRLLGADFCYRTLDGMRRIRELTDGGALGHVFALDLVFHNAYGPDKDWFYDRARSGGGCVMDLGIHLADLALWLLPARKVVAARSHLYAAGRPIEADDDRVEDYAVATIELSGGVVARLACSWLLSAGREAVIEVALHGTEGGAFLRNVHGSFHDFVAEHCVGTRREILAEPPDRWGGRAVVGWAERLAAGRRFDPAVRRYVEAARMVDAIYGRSAPAPLEVVA